MEPSGGHEDDLVTRMAPIITSDSGHEIYSPCGSLPLS